ncbi:MAG: hypothetical protein RIB80_12985 [Rhodospirillales bacterium]
MLGRLGNGRWRRGALCRVTGAAFILLLLPALPVSAEDGKWRELPGRALDVSVNGDGRAYAVSTTGEALRWRPVDKRWARMSGTFVRISAAEGNRPWALRSDGIVMRFNGLWWEPKGEGVTDVAGDAAGNVMVARTDGALYRWEPLSSSWRRFPGRAQRLALDGNGSPWVIDPDGDIYRYADAAWQRLPGRGRDIAVGGDGTAVIVDGDGALRNWNPQSGAWELALSRGDVIGGAVTPTGAPWALLDDGRIFAAALALSDEIGAEDAPQDRATSPAAPVIQAPGARAPNSAAPPATAPQSRAPQPRASQATAQSAGGQGRGNGGIGSSGSTDPATITTTESLVFSDTLATAAQVEIGRDGSVFVLTEAGNIQRWSNENRRLENFPGQLLRLAVDAKGHPWGVTVLGRVFRHNGRDWTQITGATASDIAIGGEGAVVTADVNGLLARYNVEAKRFERIDGRGLQVAVAPDGVPWTLRSDGQVQRCAATPCTPVKQRAQDIAIGPDGSVFLVTSENFLLRKRPGDAGFQRLTVPGHLPAAVAVGPMGFPWLVTAEGKLLSSRYFERDEGTDRQVALRTSTETFGSGATAQVASTSSSSGFTFTKRMRFDIFDVNLFTSMNSSISDIAVGTDGAVYIFDSNQTYVFDDKTETFIDLDTRFPGAVLDVGTDEDGVAWGLLNRSPAMVARIDGSQVKKYTVTSTSSYTPRNIAVAADGTVYVAAGEYIFVKKASSSVFRQMARADGVYRVAAGAAGDIWILSQTFTVRQWTGSRFEDRPKGKAQSADDIAAGADGTVYIIENNELLRWNATNGSFDAVDPRNTSAEFHRVGVTGDGRPWVANTSMISTENVFRGQD